MSKDLKKTLGLSAALSTVVGMVIGSGVFFKPQAIYTATGGAPGLGMIGWILAGIITIAAGLTAAEISAAIPKTGGMMVYIEEIYGPKLAFLTGWVQTVLFFPGTAAALAVIFAQQAVALVGGDSNNLMTTLPLAIIVILFLAFLNNVGSAVGGKIQVISTVCKMIPLVLLMIFGFIKGGNTNVQIFSPLVGENLSTGAVLGNVLIAALFAYDGWINVGAIAGEMKNPGKDLPKAIVGGLSVVMAVYIIINLSFLFVAPADILKDQLSPGSYVATKIFGSMGGTIVTVGIMISVFGTLNGYLLTGARTPFTLASRNLLPGSKALTKVNAGGSPYVATWFIAILACLYSLTGQFNLLTDLTVFAIWIFYVLTFIGVFKLRKERPELERPYKVPFYPIVPLIAIIGGLFVLINQLLTATNIAVSGLVVTLIGLPVYSIMKSRKN